MAHNIWTDLNSEERNVKTFCFAHHTFPLAITISEFFNILSVLTFHQIAKMSINYSALAFTETNKIFMNTPLLFKRRDQWTCYNIILHFNFFSSIFSIVLILSNFCRKIPGDIFLISILLTKHREWPFRMTFPGFQKYVKILFFTPANIASENIIA